MTDFNTNYTYTIAGPTDEGFRPGYLTSNRGRKRKHVDEDPETEQKRLCANAQERGRMQKINDALEQLRKCLPPQFHLYHRRMSKIRTLRLTMNYIRSLSELIHEDNVRRHDAYRHTLGQPHAARDPCVIKVDNQTPVDMTALQTPPATMVPYYPYLGPLCTGMDSVEAMYQTPPQLPQRQLLNPRHLNFDGTNTEKNGNNRTAIAFLVAGRTDTPVKRQQPSNNTTMTPFSRKSIKTETIPSPFQGQRNSSELDISFLSSTSESGGTYDHMTEAPTQAQQPKETAVKYLGIHRNFRQTRASSLDEMVDMNHLCEGHTPLIIDI